MNKFTKINKRYHDIDDLYIGMIAPVTKTGKTPSDIKYSLDNDEMTYIIGYKDNKILLDLISEQEYPIISKHYYDYVNKNSDIYFASGEIKKLRIYIEQELDKNKLKIELNGKKKDLISLEDIRKIYNEINEIDKTNEVKKDENEISIGDYHYIALLKEIAKTSKKINQNMKQKTKETSILKLVKWFNFRPKFFYFFNNFKFFLKFHKIVKN